MKVPRLCVKSFLFLPFQLSFQHKIGVLYCKAGQSTEEDMYNNETAGPALDEFLDLLGQRVRLKGFSKYRAQLDNKSELCVCLRGVRCVCTCKFKPPKVGVESTFLQSCVSHPKLERSVLFFVTAGIP